MINLEKEMAIHSSILAQRILWTEELVGCCPWGCTKLDMTEATQHACTHWRKKWQPTPVFLPGESQGQRSLVGCRLWSHTELDTTEVTQQQQQQLCVYCNEGNQNCYFIDIFKNNTYPLKTSVLVNDQGKCPKETMNHRLQRLNTISTCCSYVGNFYLFSGTLM